MMLVFLVHNVRVTMSEKYFQWKKISIKLALDNNLIALSHPVFPEAIEGELEHGEGDQVRVTGCQSRSAVDRALARSWTSDIRN